MAADGQRRTTRRDRFLQAYHLIMMEIRARSVHLKDGPGPTVMIVMGTILAVLSDAPSAAGAAPAALTESTPGAGGPAGLPVDYRLANGLRIILAPDDLGPGLTVAVAYGAGQAHDPPGYRGLAHLVEHLSFRGSRHLGPLGGISLIEELGGGFSGVTESERTVFLASVPTRELPAALWIESERMAFAAGAVDEKTVELEKRIVANERAEYRHSPSQAFFWHQLRILYPEGHPFRPTDDEDGDGGAIGLAGARWFFQSAYRPDNAVLVVAGSFPLEAARGLVDRYFRDIRNPTLPRRQVEAPPPRLCGVHRLRVSHPFELPIMAAVWVVPVRPSVREQAALEAVAKLLESRLAGELVKRRPRAGAVAVGVSRFETHALLSADIELLTGADWGDVEAAVRQEAARLATHPPDQRELRRVRSQLLTLAVEALEDRTQVARALATNEGGDADGRRNAIDGLDAGTIGRAAAALLSPDRMLVAHWEPHRGAPLQGYLIAEENPCP
jgi:zinc protease